MEDEEESLKDAPAQLERKEYTLEDLMLEKELTDHALKLHEIRQQALLRLNKMTDASAKELMNFVLNECIKMSQSELSLLGLLNGDETVLSIHAWSKEAMAQCAVKETVLDLPVAGAGLWAEPIRLRKAVIVNDYCAPHPSKKGCPEGHVQLKRYMGVPVIESNRVVCLGAVANKESKYDASDIKAFEVMLYDMWRLILRKRMETELEERVEEIERMNRAMVGRELTMEELKKENKELTKRIEELSAMLKRNHMLA